MIGSTPILTTIQIKTCGLKTHIPKYCIKVIERIECFNGLSCVHQGHFVRTTDIEPCHWSSYGRSWFMTCMEPNIALNIFTTEQNKTISVYHDINSTFDVGHIRWYTLRDMHILFTFYIVRSDKFTNRPTSYSFLFTANNFANVILHSNHICSADITIQCC